MKSESSQALHPAPQAGGSDVFLSFLATLLRTADAGTLPAESIPLWLHRWGQDMATRAGIPIDLSGALDSIALMLRTLGLVRVFEPAEGVGQLQIMVLRCTLARYIVAERRREGLATPPLLAPLVQGALLAAQQNYTVTEHHEGMLRNDEYLLTLQATKTQ